MNVTNLLEIDGNDGSLEMREAEQRLAHAAEVLQRPKPTSLLEDDGQPSREVRHFCKESGVSLDYIYCGDTSALIRKAARAGTGNNPDPVIAALEQYRSAADALTASKEEDIELERLFLEVEQSLIETPVSTPKGAALKLQYALSISGLIHGADDCPDRQMFEQIIECLSQTE